MKLTVTSSPHIRGKDSTKRIMRDVLLALMPALLFGFVHFGLRAAAVSAVCIGAAILAELAANRFIFKDNRELDGSAAVTGMLLSMVLPVSVPMWLAALGSVFAIIVVKAFCGGLGQNMFNPALAARAFMLMIFPAGMVRYPASTGWINGADAATAATPLHHMVRPALPEEGLADVFLGNIPGSIGEVSALLLLLGGGYLVYKRVISLRIPGTYLGTVAVLTMIFSRGENHLLWMLYSLFSGGLMLGAIFMATDYATSPVTPRGQILYGVGCGALTVCFRRFGLFPEGVTYAILIMNGLSWAIDRWTPPVRYGAKKEAADHE